MAVDRITTSWFVSADSDREIVVISCYWSSKVVVSGTERVSGSCLPWEAVSIGINNRLNLNDQVLCLDNLPSGSGTTSAEDLVPTLLGMYDALIGRTPAAPQPTPRQPPPQPPPKPAYRPLSVISIASSSSSSSSSVTSSCSGGAGRRLGATAKSAAYLASIESLEDSDECKRPPHLQRLKTPSQGSGDSGVHSPCSYISTPSLPHSRPRYCDPHLSYRDRVVIEIVETEAVYVADLRQVILVSSSLVVILSVKNMLSAV
ncbi:Pleckstrin y domain-containing G member 1 [Homalodisca vitripennis]|nr:Pleckstrin y domain-containing G member 1 [Homalodisca vitripennis]